MKKPFVRFVLKFAEGQQVFLQNGRFLSKEGEVSRINEWLERYPPSDVFPLFDLSSPGQEPSATEKSLGLDRFFCVVLEAEREEVESRLHELNRLPFLEEAYIEEPTDLAR